MLVWLISCPALLPFCVYPETIGWVSGSYVRHQRDPARRAGALGSWVPDEEDQVPWEGDTGKGGKDDPEEPRAHLTIRDLCF